MWFLFVMFIVPNLVIALDNGLALTPPMGWMPWQRYRCVVDCDKYPNECINEKLIRRTADLMVKEGYRSHGYEYIIVDDCWSSLERDEYGRLQADPSRFPSGMKSLGDYIHARGLKFGIYANYGTYTCAGYPGSQDYLQIDAHTFADWGVDYVKLDGCYSTAESKQEGYRLFGKFLNDTGRPIVYSCSWPAYQEVLGVEADYPMLQSMCNLWRNYRDIDDSLSSMRVITDWFTSQQYRIAGYAGPGSWNDPDMLIIGNFGLSVEQSKAQMTMWCIMAAPLIMSNDLTNMNQEFKSILQNQDAISIDQDPLGIQGLMIHMKNDIDIWRKQILPTVNGQPSYAFGFVSRREDGVRYPIQVSFSELGLNNENGYLIKNVFEHKTWHSRNSDELELTVPPSGAILLKAIPVG